MTKKLCEVAVIFFVGYEDIESYRFGSEKVRDESSLVIQIESH